MEYEKQLIIMNNLEKEISRERDWCHKCSLWICFPCVICTLWCRDVKK